MTDFIIRPHGRLHDWIAHEKGYFRDEGLRYQLVADEERENRLKEVDPATGALREIRSGAYEMYEQGGGSKGEAHSDISCACHWTVNEAARRAHVGQCLLGDARRDHGARGLAHPPACGSGRPRDCRGLSVRQSLHDYSGARAIHSARGYPAEVWRHAMGAC